MPDYIITVEETTTHKYRVTAESPEAAKATFESLPDDAFVLVDYDCLNHETVEIRNETTGVVYDYAALEAPDDEEDDE